MCDRLPTMREKWLIYLTRLSAVLEAIYFLLSAVVCLLFTLEIYPSCRSAARPSRFEPAYGDDGSLTGSVDKDSKYSHHSSGKEVSGRVRVDVVDEGRVHVGNEGLVHVGNNGHVYVADEGHVHVANVANEGLVHVANEEHVHVANNGAETGSLDADPMHVSDSTCSGRHACCRLHVDVVKEQSKTCSLKRGFTYSLGDFSANHAACRVQVDVGSEGSDIVLVDRPKYSQTDALSGPHRRCRLHADVAESNGRLHADVADVKSRLHGDVADVKSRLHADVTESNGRLHADVADVKRRLHADRADVKSRLHADGADVKSRLHAEGADVNSRLPADGTDVKGRLHADVADVKERTQICSSDKGAKNSEGCSDKDASCRQHVEVNGDGNECHKQFVAEEKKRGPGGDGGCGGHCVQEKGDGSNCLQVAGESSHPKLLELPWVYRMIWVLRNVQASCTFEVFFFFSLWAALYSIPYDALDTQIHCMNFLITLADVALSAIPMRILHFYQPVAVGIAYCTFTVVFWAAGGRNEKGEPYIYITLNYEEEPERAAVYLVILCLLVVPITHFLFCLWSYTWSRILAPRRHHASRPSELADSTIPEETVRV
ncbi:hypothetical protein CBR_g38574 [Chara braunii]|uniref:Uncharacterized protein n=1 Tax=Chara braunii TaxID=69332 RepID=A0A388K0G3_CHABU|nr:hypothetical protein CBR_g38574 [Chara braunii]|eukprot:GBG63506.1 hypothetical protein CBR_g38574 [Chara braunii]